MTSTLHPHLVLTVKCAAPGCTNVHRDSTHWFVITVEPGRFFCGPFISVLRLQAADQPACGQACAQKLLEHFLAATACHHGRNHHR